MEFSLINVSILLAVIFNVSIPIVQSEKAQERPISRVVNGHEARPHSAPYLVSLRSCMFDLVACKHRCGAAILNQNWIVTAAHCQQSVHYLRTTIIFAYAGVHRMLDNSWTEGVQVRKLTKLILHPLAIIVRGPTALSYASPHDILLGRTDAPFEFTSTVKAINLPPADLKVTPAMSSDLIFRGWGLLATNGDEPEVLQEMVSPEVLTFEECSQKQPLVKENALSLEETICLSTKDIVGACQGDSGGPLVLNVSKTNKFPVIVGLSSSRSSTCHSGVQHFCPVMVHVDFINYYIH